MIVALTGSSGLIGSAIHARLAAAGEVRTIARREGGHYKADLSDPESVAKLDLKGCDALVHSAGVVDEDFVDDPQRAFRQAIQGMAALVKVARDSGVKRALYISSAHIYGPFAGHIDETSPPNPLHDYAIAHFASEQILRRSASEDFRTAVVRPNAVFGVPPDIARFRRWRLIPFSFPKTAVEERLITLGSHGEQRRNFVGTEDIAAAVATWLADSSAGRFQGINSVGKDSMTVYDFARLCASLSEKVTGKPCRVVRPAVDSPPKDDYDFTTRDPRFIGATDIAQTVERFMRLLLRQGEQKA
jgi:UDP-glucose 4-epimerase